MFSPSHPKLFCGYCDDNNANLKILFADGPREHTNGMVVAFECSKGHVFDFRFMQIGKEYVVTSSASIETGTEL